MSKQTKLAQYRLLKRIASPLSRLEQRFPNSPAIRAASARLSFIRSVYGVYILNMPGDRTFELCATGYGRFISDAIAAQEKPFLFLDIGANLGLFSLLAARNPNCVQGWAFEPVPQTFEILKTNLARNRAERIAPVRGAITDIAREFVHLSFREQHSGLATITDEGAGTVTAPVITTQALDALVSRRDLAILAKIDVEGSEVGVLSVLRQTHLYPLIGEILVEVSERTLGSAKLETLLRMLREDGYRELSRAGPPDHYDARYGRRA
jgi:FkbM family methyltransferase